MYRTLLAAIIFAFSSHAMAKMTIASKDFTDNGKMSKEFSCEGKKVSPELNWLDVPKAAKTLVLIEIDPDAKSAPSGVFDHWVMFNIPANTKSLPQDAKKLPAGTMKGRNSMKTNDYVPACPPTGDHHYVFTLYALDTKLDLPEGATKEQVLDKLSGHILEQATITGMYQKDHPDVEKPAVAKPAVNVKPAVVNPAH